MSINEYYENTYEKILESGVIGSVASVYHRMLEFGHKNTFFGTVLEIGAGNAQHHKFVKHQFDRYISSDIRKPNTESMSAYKEKHEFMILNAEDLSIFESESIDRIVVTCVLPHLDHPEKALEEWSRVLKDGGVLDIYVPCEPSVLLGIAQRMTTRRKVRKHGYNYESIQYREHRNHYPMLRMLINEVLHDYNVKTKHFPPGMRWWQLSLFTTFRCKKSTVSD
jgi:SAM-dependent methyltransferase